jgi:hypothetical protein
VSLATAPISTWDWTIQDGRLVPPTGAINSSDAAVGAGVFHGNRRRDDRWVVEGNAQRRAQWVLRHAPPPGYVVPAAALQACAGRYELFPGFFLTVVARENGLEMTAPTWPTIVLSAESETIFTQEVTGNTAEFQRDAQGRVTSLSIDNSGQLMVARRSEDLTQ